MGAPTPPQLQPAACPSCGRPDPGAGAFCVGCGQSLSAASAATTAASSSILQGGQVACPSCGSANPAASTYCQSCGSSLTVPQEPVAVAEPGSGIDRLVAAAGGQSLLQLVQANVIPFIYVASIGWYDYLSHRQVPALVILGLLAVGGIMFRKAIYRGMAPLQQVIPQRFFPIVLAGVPALLYFLIRGSGTLSSGGALMTSVAVGGLMTLIAARGSLLDKQLIGWYEARNRILPRPVRMLAPLVVGVFLSFALVQGSITDIGALFGGTTSTSATPSGGKIFLATVLTMVVSFLLMRDPVGEAPQEGPSS